MGMQLRTNYQHHHLAAIPPPQVSSLSSSNSLLPFSNHINGTQIQNMQNKVVFGLGISPTIGKTTRGGFGIVSSSVAPPLWDGWIPDKGSQSPSLSDVIWPSAGAFAAMAVFGKMDQLLAPTGLSMTIAPLGAVSAVLFATPSSPAARKYNMFMAQIGCAAIGVLSFLIFGPGWLARSTALSAAIAFMIYTRAVHPPAASLPLLFIDGAKLHHLNFWYALFPGVTGCILLCLIQEVVSYLKDNFKF